MNDWQSKVVDEKRDLDGKLERLAIYLSGNASQLLDSTDRGLLMEQQHAMRLYSEVLAARIERF